MKTEIKLVDARLAEAWLKQSNDNRPLRSSHVAYLVKEMTDRRWRLTHQGIAFDSQGNLLDGQHRLRAIVEFKAPVMLQVSYYESGDNVDFAFPIIDRGLMRGISDLTRIVPKVIQIYNVLFTLGTKKRRIPPDDYLVLDCALGEITHQFLAACPYQRTYYTSATIRAAAVYMLILKRSPLSHVARLFKAWGTGDTANTPPVVNAFMNYVPGLKMGATQRVDVIKLFTATAYALLENHANKSRLIIQQARIDETVLEVRQMVDMAMQGKLPKEPSTIEVLRKERVNEQKKIMKKLALDIEAKQSKLSMDSKEAL